MIQAGTIRCALLAAVLIAALGSVSRAVTTTKTLNFSTANQSVWGPGEADTQSFSYFLGPQWEGGSQHLWLNVANASQLTNPGASVMFLASEWDAGRVGFEFGIESTTGALDVDFPIDVSIDHPAQVMPGDTIPVGTSWSHAASGHKMDYKGPGFRLKADFVMEGALRFGAGYDDNSYQFLGAPTGIGAVFTSDESIDPDGDRMPYNIFGSPNQSPDPAIMTLHQDDITLFDTNGEIRQTLFTIEPGSSAINYSIPGTNGVTGFGVTAPNPINLFDGTVDSNNLDELYDRDTGNIFLQANIDLDGFVTTVLNAAGLPIPPLGGTYPSSNPDGFLSGVASLSYETLDVDFVFGPALSEWAEVTPDELPIIITSSDGQVRNGVVGDDFYFTAPANGMELDFDVQVDFMALLEHVLGLDFAVEIPWQLGKLSLNVGVVGGVINLGPVFSGTLDAASLPVTDLYRDKFGLEGFETQSMAFSVDVIPEPTSLALLGLGGLWLARRRVV